MRSPRILTLIIPVTCSIFPVSWLSIAEKKFKLAGSIVMLSNFVIIFYSGYTALTLLTSLLLSHFIQRAPTLLPFSPTIYTCCHVWLSFLSSSSPSSWRASPPRCPGRSGCSGCRLTRPWAELREEKITVKGTVSQESLSPSTQTKSL